MYILQLLVMLCKYQLRWLIVGFFSCLVLSRAKKGILKSPLSVSSFSFINIYFIYFEAVRRWMYIYDCCFPWYMIFFHYKKTFLSLQNVLPVVLRFPLFAVNFAISLHVFTICPVNYLFPSICISVLQVEFL